MGLYVQVQANPEIRGKLERVRPAVVLVHLDGGDLIPWIRQALPETFVVGRYWWSPADQDRLLAQSGAALAELMLGVKGASQCQALMLFNEYLPSPYEAGWESLPGKPNKPPDTGWLGRAQRYDVMQVEFRERLLAAGLEAVAYNFPSANWTRAQWYRELQPLTVAAYRFFGHHIYAWPRLMGAEPWWNSNMAEAMAVIDAFPDRVHIVTEMAVTRQFNQQGPDVGWLSQHGDSGPLRLDDYAADLAGAHEELCRRSNVLGAALFNAAPEATWHTFAVPGELIDKVSGFKCQVSGGPVSGGPVVAAPQRFRLPLAAGSYSVSQWYGDNPERYNNWGHEGLDLAAPAGTPVMASAAGTVARLPRSDVYGTYVRLIHEGRFATADGTVEDSGRWETVYAHLSRRDVQPGQVVAAGEEVGQVGSTGRSTGNHLHFGLRRPGQKSTDRFWGYSDPASWLGLARPQTTDGKRQLIAEIRTRLAELEAML